jgi:hypothetical protein
MTVPYTIPHDADAIANSISKVVNAQSTGTLASNANLANNSVIKSYVDTAVANQLTTIKTDFRPKFARASYVGGVTSGPDINQSATASTTITYDIADFESLNNDFSASKITGIVIEGQVRARYNASAIEAKLPDGVFTKFVECLVTGGDYVESTSTAYIPVNNSSGTFSVRFSMGETPGQTCSFIIRGFTYLPGLD